MSKKSETALAAEEVDEDGEELLSWDSKPPGIDSNQVNQVMPSQSDMQKGT